MSSTNFRYLLWTALERRPQFRSAETAPNAPTVFAQNRPPGPMIETSTCPGPGAIALRWADHASHFSAAGSFRRPEIRTASARLGLAGCIARRICRLTHHCVESTNVLISGPVRSPPPFTHPKNLIEPDGTHPSVQTQKKSRYQTFSQVFVYYFS